MRRAEPARGDGADGSPPLGREERRALAHRRAAFGAQTRRGGGRALPASSRRMRSAPGKPPARAPPVRRTFWIAQVSPASTGVVVASMSWPYRQSPASSRSESRAPRPMGATLGACKQRLGKGHGRRRRAPKSRTRPRRCSPSGEIHRSTPCQGRIATSMKPHRRDTRHQCGQAPLRPSGPAARPGRGRSPG